MPCYTGQFYRAKNGPYPRREGHNFFISSLLDNNHPSKPSPSTMERITIKIPTKKGTYFTIWGQNSPNRTLWVSLRLPDHCVRLSSDALATYSSPNQSLLVRMNGKLLRMSDNALYCLKLRNRLLHISIWLTTREMASVCGRFDPNKLTQDDDIKEEKTNG